MPTRFGSILCATLLAAAAAAAPPATAPRAVALPESTRQALEQLGAADATGDPARADHALAIALDRLGAELPALTAQQLAAVLGARGVLLAPALARRIPEDRIVEGTELANAFDAFTQAELDAVSRIDIDPDDPSLDPPTEPPLEPPATIPECFAKFTQCLKNCRTQRDVVMRMACALDCEMDFYACVTVTYLVYPLKTDPGRSGTSLEGPPG